MDNYTLTEQAYKNGYEAGVKAALRLSAKDLNRLVRTAIDHGGDRGGPYFSNDIAMTGAMIHFAMLLGFDACVPTDDYPYFREREV